MPRVNVPPNFIGTDSADNIVGEELNTSFGIEIEILNSGIEILSPGAIGIKILSPGSIDTRSGNDTIKGSGSSTGGNVGDDEYGGDGGTGTGIANNGTLNTGSGNDTITATGNGGNGVRGFGYNALPVVNGGTGTGITNSGSINTGDGENTITGTGIGGNGFTDIRTYNSSGVAYGGKGTGITNGGSINTGEKFLFADSSLDYSTLVNGA
ncbi:hypothetical protein LC605_12755 [Nostoc sp. CHAB 5836]|uniref:hypothetical protein n=1 Tax=Nostoc sp. CHAB 5836 TaxID=2780404 RepID=UPI001E5F8DE1|nr:hypothetical protein [Nostoc sp. CHAB 5836]MCC5615925.1 hypothetical protein [Nostoc sp. CHAB 5836]